LFGIIGAGAIAIARIVKPLWEVGKALGKTGKFIGKSFYKMIPSIGKSFKSVKSFFTGIKPGMKLNKAGRWMGYGADGRFAAVKAPVSLGKRISTFLGKIGKPVGKLFGKIGKPIGKFGTKMIPLFGKLSSILKVVSKFLGPIMVIWGVLSTTKNILKRLKLSKTTSLPKLINTAIAGML